MISFPHAKINLGINVLEKRSDGFHNIESVFYPIGLSDVLEIVPFESQEKPIILTVSGMEIIGHPTDNLVFKAVLKVAEHYSISPVKIHLHKIIPSGAGLGGGSSDASFTINLLNNIFNLKIGKDELLKMAGELGSDCPYFIQGGVKLVGGTGNVLSPFQLSLNGYFIVLVKPKISVDTTNAYLEIKPKFPEINIAEILSSDIKHWKDVLKNDFEENIFNNYPEIMEIKNILYQSGAQYVSMSGSGSSVYGIFDIPPKINFNTKEYFIWQSKL